MMKSVLIDSFAVWWIAIPTLQNYDTSIFASLSNSLIQSVHHVVRIHRKRQHLQHHHGQPRKIFWDIYLKECPPRFHVPTIRNIYDMIRSFTRTQHDQVQIHLHTPGLLAKRHAFVFNTSALISALVLSSDSKLTGRWPTRNSSRTSDLSTSSRCRPTSRTRKSPLVRPTPHILRLLVLLRTPVLNFDHHLFCVFPLHHQFRHCLLQQLETFEYFRCLIRIHRSHTINKKRDDEILPSSWCMNLFSHSSWNCQKQSYQSWKYVNQHESSQTIIKCFELSVKSFGFERRRRYICQHVIVPMCLSFVIGSHSIQFVKSSSLWGPRFDSFSMNCNVWSIVIKSSILKCHPVTRLRFYSASATRVNLDILRIRHGISRILCENILISFWKKTMAPVWLLDLFVNIIPQWRPPNEICLHELLLNT